MNGLPRKRRRSGLADAVFASLFICFTPHMLFAQLTAGAIEGVVRDSAGHPRAGVIIRAIGSVSASRWSTKSGVGGEFQLIMPHGGYEIRPDFKTGSEPAIEVYVLARQVIHLSLTLANNSRSGLWTSTTAKPLGRFAESYSLAGTLLNEEPATVVEPLDFTGTQNTRTPLISQRDFLMDSNGVQFGGDERNGSIPTRTSGCVSGRSGTR